MAQRFPSIANSIRFEFKGQGTINREPVIVVRKLPLVVNALYGHLGGISELEWQGHTPPGGHLVIRELFCPEHSGLLSVARNKWDNPVWQKIKKKFTELFETAMTSEIYSRDKIFCQAVKSQVGQAIRMNRCRLKDLMDAWRFLFFHVCHPYGNDEQIEIFDRWAENESSIFSGSRWLSR
jgi:hypothetical protein